MFHNIKQYFNKKNLTNPKYQYLFEPYEGDELVCFDCETTGLDPTKDDIISIGAVIIKNNTILSSQKFERFVKPKANLTADTIKIHQIRKCDLDNAKDIDEVIEEFLDFIRNRPLVGYFLSFDKAMINKYIKPKFGITLPNISYEVSEIYYKKIATYNNPDVDLRFNTIMHKLELPLMSVHDAINDAIMSALIYIKLQNTNNLRD